MALPSSGSISLNQVNVELGNSGTASINMGSVDVRGLFGVASGAISLADGHGKTSQSFKMVTYNKTQGAVFEEFVFGAPPTPGIYHIHTRRVQELDVSNPEYTTGAALTLGYGTLFNDSTTGNLSIGFDDRVGTYTTAGTGTGIITTTSEVTSSSQWPLATYETDMVNVYTPSTPNWPNTQKLTLQGLVHSTDYIQSLYSGAGYGINRYSNYTYGAADPDPANWAYKNYVNGSRASRGSTTCWYADLSGLYNTVYNTQNPDLFGSYRESQTNETRVVGNLDSNGNLSNTNGLLIYYNYTPPEYSAYFQSYMASNTTWYVFGMPLGSTNRMYGFSVSRGSWEGSFDLTLAQLQAMHVNGGSNINQSVEVDVPNNRWRWWFSGGYADAWVPLQTTTAASQGSLWKSGVKYV